jgi:DNA-binding IclR family transcriptional regulator
VPRKGAQTAARALKLLQILVGCDQALSLSEFTRISGLDKSNAYRLMRELEALNFVSREADGRHYSVGLELVSLAAAVLQKLDFSDVAYGPMQRLADATNETVALHVRHGRYRTAVRVIEGRHAITRVVRVGETLPLYAGPTGKVMLAYLTEAEAREVINWAGDCGVDLALLDRQLAAIRTNGYIASVADRTPGVGGLSGPVFDGQGVVGAVSISGPADRWTMQAMQAAAPLIVSQTTALSAQMGYVARPAESMQSGAGSNGRR